MSPCVRLIVMFALVAAPPACRHAGTGALAPAARAPAAGGGAGLDLDGMDRTVAPGDDFFT